MPLGWRGLDVSFWKASSGIFPGIAFGSHVLPVVPRGCHPVVALPCFTQNELQLLKQVYGSLLVVGSLNQKNWIEHQLILLSQEVVALG